MNFKALLILLLVSLVIVSCRDAQETDATNADKDTNSEQVSTSITTLTPNSLVLERSNGFVYTFEPSG